MSLEFDTKQRAGKAVVDPSDRCPMPRVLTLNFVPVNKPCIRTCRVQEQIEFTWIVLTVAISVEDPILGSRFEAAAKYRSVAQIHCMRNHMESISPYCCNCVSTFAVSSMLPSLTTITS